MIGSFLLMSTLLLMVSLLFCIAKNKIFGAIYSQTAPVILKFWVDYLCLHILMEIYLTFNIMLVSGVQHNDSIFVYIMK